jgi:solute carrier family 35 protein E3
MKVAVAPTVIVMEFVMFGKLQSVSTVLSVVVVCIGIIIATVTDPIVMNNAGGAVVGLCSTLITALYQIWAGSKQKELEASSSQLLKAYTPISLLLLTILVPLYERVGWVDKEEGKES